MKKYLIIILFISSFSAIKAQDPIYMNIGLAKYCYNPAIFGIDYKYNIGINLRQIYPFLPNTTYNSFAFFSADINQYKVGTGVSFERYYEGNGALEVNIASLNFSKYFVFDRKYVLSFGLKTGYLNRKMNWSKFIFSDQLDPVFGNNGSTSAIPTDNENFNNFDVSSGIVFMKFNETNNSLISFSVNHMNSPNYSHYSSEIERYPLTYILIYQGNYDINNITDKVKKRILPVFLYSYQRKNTNIILGTDFIYSQFLVGLKMRTKLRELSKNQTFIISSLGFNLNNDMIRFVYNYEYPITSTIRGGGIHEVGLQIVLKNKHKKNCDSYI